MKSPLKVTDVLLFLDNILSSYWKVADLRQTNTYINTSYVQVTEDDHDWIQNGRTHKLRSRKGRSIVHKNLEDNYGAVVVANHEALAQVLENVSRIWTA